MTYEIEPIGQVRGGRIEAIDDDWEAVRATIELDPDQWSPDALAGLEEFSHLDGVRIDLVEQVDHVDVGELLESGQRVG